MLSFFLLLALITAMYALQGWIYSGYGLESLQYRCYFDKEEVTEGDTVHLIEEIENRKLLPLPWLKSEFSVSKHLSFAGTHSVVTDHTRFVSSFFTLKGDCRIRREWEVTCLRRGEYRIDRVLLVTADLLGIERKSKAACDTGSALTVLPRCYDAEGSLLTMCSQMLGELPAEHRLLTDPFSVAGSRPYTGYEPMRRMDWKTSARCAELMVRTEEPCQQKELVIAFTAQIGEFGRRYVNESISEHTIRVCAKLFQECTERQQPFSVHTCCSVHGELYSANAACSMQHYEALLRALAALETEPLDTLDHCVPPLSNAALVLVTPYISEDIHRLKHRFPDSVVFLTSSCDSQGIPCIRVCEEVQNA